MDWFPLADAIVYVDGFNLYYGALKRDPVQMARRRGEPHKRLLATSINSGQLDRAADHPKLVRENSAGIFQLPLGKSRYYHQVNARLYPAAADGADC